MLFCDYGAHMLRERLKEIELRITELADYMRVSRPTMYKFIENYDLKKFDAIRKDVLTLFNYIVDNELIGKKNVVNYILTNLVEFNEQDEQSSLFATLKNYIVSNPESKKSKFLSDCFLDDEFCDVIYYLTEVAELNKKNKLSVKDKEKLKPYINLKQQIKHTEDK